MVNFLGVLVDKGHETKKYLQDYLLGKAVILKNTQEIGKNGRVSSYVYLKNRIFINAYLIKSGLASPDDQVDHRYSKKFRLLAEKAVKPSSSLSG
jgi:endonuclease YncB( thermonuclease family)